jgi:hypothetical protein
MFKRIPGFALWAFLALAIALIPLACGSDDTNNDAATDRGMTAN